MMTDQRVGKAKVRGDISYVRRRLQASENDAEPVASVQKSILL